jgi:hypothetical protein
MTAALVAGCGGSSSPKRTTLPATIPSTTSPSSSSSGSSSSSSSSSGGFSSGSSNPTLAQAGKDCKTSVKNAHTLSPTLKQKLTSACDKVASGDVNAAKQVITQVCKQVISSSLPPGVPSALKNQVVTACKKVSG